MASENYYCSNCGGIMQFDVNSQKLKCPNCDTVVDIVGDKDSIVEHPFSEDAIRRLGVQEKTSETRQCQGCGATVEIAPDCTATKCLYCGSDYVLAQKQEAAVVPDGVVPFKVDKNKAGEIFQNWIKKRWLAPNKLKYLYEHGGIQGTYLPYWTFDADIDCDYSAQGGKHRKVKETKSDGSVVEKTVTDWYPTNGRVHKFFDDVEISATKNMKASLLKGIEPYDTKGQLESYSPQYMSGYSAECYSVPLEDAHKDANQIMENELRSMARSDVRRHYDEVKDVHIRPHYKKETFKHVMIPVYATSYSYQSKNYTVLLNGQSGKISGDYPKSPFKIAIIIAIIVALITGIFFLTRGNSENKNNSKNDTTAITQEYGAYLYDDSDTYDFSDMDEGEIYVWDEAM